MMNTHAIVDEDGMVDHLTDKPGFVELLPGQRPVALAESTRGFPAQPHPRAALHCSDAGELTWRDPRSELERWTDADAAARARRAELLAASDWVVSRAVERGEAVPLQWREYRQALRDITAHAWYPFGVQWPVAPET